MNGSRCEKKLRLGFPLATCGKFSQFDSMSIKVNSLISCTFRQVKYRLQGAFQLNCSQIKSALTFVNELSCSITLNSFVTWNDSMNSTDACVGFFYLENVAVVFFLLVQLGINKQFCNIDCLFNSLSKLLEDKMLTVLRSGKFI